MRHGFREKRALLLASATSPISESLAHQGTGGNLVTSPGVEVREFGAKKLPLGCRMKEAEGRWKMSRVCRGFGDLVTSVTVPERKKGDHQVALSCRRLRGAYLVAGARLRLQSTDYLDCTSKPRQDPSLSKSWVASSGPSQARFN